MGPHRLRVAIATSWTSLLLVVPSHAEIREFGWYGTVGQMDPAFASALPPGANIAVGSPAFVRYEFETTTPDLDLTPTAGDYVGALTSFTTRIGSFAFTQRIGGPANSIVTLADSLFRFYESVTSVDPSLSIPTYPDLRGDVLFEPITPVQIPNDDLLLTVPDPDAWSTASSGVLGPTGTVLLDIDLVAICVGSCQPVPEPTSPLAVTSGALMTIGLARRRHCYAKLDRTCESRSGRRAEQGHRAHFR
jgi:hypothetical protein